MKAEISMTSSVNWVSMSSALKAYRGVVNRKLNTSTQTAEARKPYSRRDTNPAMMSTANMSRVMIFASENPSFCRISQNRVTTARTPRVQARSLRLMSGGRNWPTKVGSAGSAGEVSILLSNMDRSSYNW